MAQRCGSIVILQPTTGNSKVESVYAECLSDSGWGASLRARRQPNTRSQGVTSPICRDHTKEDEKEDEK